MKKSKPSSQSGLIWVSVVLASLTHWVQAGEIEDPAPEGPEAAASPAPTRQELRQEKRDAQKERIRVLNEARRREFERFKIRGSVGAGYGFETGNQFVLPDAPVELVEQAVDEVGSLGEALAHPITSAAEMRELADRMASDAALAEETREAVQEFATETAERYEDGKYKTDEVRVDGDLRLDWNVLSAGTDGALVMSTGSAPRLDVQARPFATAGVRSAGIGAFGNFSSGPGVQTVAFGPGIRLANTAIILDPVCQIGGTADMVCGEIRSLPARPRPDGSDRPVRATGELMAGVNPEALGDAAQLSDVYGKAALGLETNLRPRHRTTAIVGVEGWGAAGTWGPETPPSNADDFLTGRTIAYAAGVNVDVRWGRNNQPVTPPLDPVDTTEEVRGQAESGDSR